MPAVFGVINVYDMEPAAGHAQESSKDAAVEIATIRNELGVTVVAKAKKLRTKTITVSGQGTANFALVVAGAITKGTAFATSAKLTESHDTFPTFEHQAISYHDPE